MKTVVICLSPSYFNTGQRVAKLLYDAWFFPAPELMLPDTLPADGVGGVVLVGSVPEAVGFVCEGGLNEVAKAVAAEDPTPPDYITDSDSLPVSDGDPLFGPDSDIEGQSSEPAVVVVDGDCRYVAPLTPGRDGSSDRLASFLAGAIKGTPIVTTGQSTSLWRLDKLAEPFGWSIDIRGEMGEITDFFRSFGHTALLIEIRDRGTRYLLSSLPGHVDLYYSVYDIPPGQYGLVIAVTPRILPGDISPRIVTYIPPCLLPLEMDGEELTPLTISEKETDPTESSPANDYVESPDIHAILECGGYYPEAFANPTHAEIESMELTGDYGEQILSHTLENGKALIVTLLRRCVRRGHVEVVGIDSRDSGLVTVRGADYVRGADLLVYSSLRTPRSLLDWRRPTSMTVNLDEVTEEELREAVLACYHRGLLTVWLLPPRTADLINDNGPDLDPSQYLTSLNLRWSMTPGVR